MAPTVDYDDIVEYIHASTTGTTPNRTLTFGVDTVSEASVNRQLLGATAYIHWFIGDTNWNTADATLAPLVQDLLYLYAAARVLSVLAGGLMVTGFNVTMTDLNMQRSERFTVYHDMISDFTNEAESIALQMTQFTLYKAGGVR